MLVTVTERPGYVVITAPGCPPSMLIEETAQQRAHTLLAIIRRATPGRLVDVRFLTGVRTLLSRYDAADLCFRVQMAAGNVLAGHLGEEEEPQPVEEDTPVVAGNGTCHPAVFDLGGEAGGA